MMLRKREGRDCKVLDVGARLCEVLHATDKLCDISRYLGWILGARLKIKGEGDGSQQAAKRRLRLLNKGEIEKKKSRFDKKKVSAFDRKPSLELTPKFLNPASLETLAGICYLSQIGKGNRRAYYQGLAMPRGYRASGSIRR
eukprot:1320309-Amorphochlora_amoeboformis.AAC.1